MSSMREPSRRKGQRAQAGPGPFLDNPSETQSSKRIRLHSAAFYDALSKVRLTRRALKELDQRTRQTNRLQRPTSTPRRVTRNTSNEIQIFARDGGPELCDLRGYPAPRNVTRTMTPSHSSGSRRATSTVLTSTSPKSKRSSAYDSNFEQHLVDHHVYMNNRKSKPGNLTELHQRLAQPRPSLSLSRFSDDEFEDFRRKYEDVIDEGEVMRVVIPIMAGNSDIPNKQNLLFTGLDPIANNTTVDAKPDFHDGTRLGDVDKQVQGGLKHFIIPTGHRTAPVAPNFFLEAKGPRGGTDVAKRQACYDGALGARGMHKLQSYGQDEPVYDGNAYTISTTYHDGTLRIYTTHPTAGPGNSTEYHMSQVDGWNMTGNPNTCRQALTAFRNARDWAQEQRDGFILAANERARSVNAGPSPFEASDHNDASAPSGVQDVSHLTQAEDPIDDPRYSMSQQYDQ
ncbi:hypothetical protein B0J14DRAFT_707781 [Halenospora varia]|nr:hypothetical protein B0J14DRAFT_707781 [Halenospora varia]